MCVCVLVFVCEDVSWTVLDVYVWNGEQRAIAFSFGLRYDVMSEECLSLVSSNDCQSRRIYTVPVR